MKWQSVKSFPYGGLFARETQKERYKKEAAFHYVVEQLGFDEWANYEPVRSLRKLLNGERSYNAGKKSKEYNRVQWIDHAKYLKDSSNERVALITQPYQYDDMDILETNLNMEGCTIITGLSRWLSFYWPRKVDILLIVTNEDAPYYLEKVNEMNAYMQEIILSALEEQSHEA